ncbi:hypothetical protein GCM10011613_20570 [Cellvibrio zantedeschiae]|uniref:DUF6794 domain-containing protein n=1 Tax=Cellvibrio zantedeschiae TaxID=1237077 RepID=A0ABQ3B1F8_9GAMM|nr:DUF6794 domain-containing protein [Cellvibrio zantedeschiae]GGY74980.1 hypothetical protein GCM10011613_20570 [Cellvibrio zantedeschiae]
MVKNIIALATLTLAISGCATYQKVQNQVTKSVQETEAVDSGESLPSTCQEAIELIASTLDEESLKTLKETKKEDLAMFHFSWGMGIRNGYGLWSKKSPIRLSCAKRIGKKDIHPDNASGIIMEEVWRIVNGI